VEWERILRLEKKSVLEYHQMAWLGLKMLLVPKRIWRRHYRQCRKCPIFNRLLRVCRPVPGSNLGCGCYMPLKARAFWTWRGCWARVNLPDSGVGWT